MNLMLMRLTGENEGDGENDEESAVESHTEGCPSQSRLNQPDRNTENNFINNNN